MKDPRPTLFAASLALLSGCIGTGYHQTVPQRSARVVVSDVSSEIAALAQELEGRASLRSSLGSARILVEDLEAIGPRKGRHRFAILDEEDLRAVRDTIRYELEMALGNRLNILDPDAAMAAEEPAGDGVNAASLRQRLGATHAVVGTFVRNGEVVDISLRLVDLRDGWIVATAERRIPRFVPRAALSLRSGSLEEQARVKALQRTTAMSEPDGEDPTASSAPEGSFGDEAAAELASTAPIIPEDAKIEFQAGPAAARFGVTGTVILPPAGAAGTAVPTTSGRGEHH